MKRSGTLFSELNVYLGFKKSIYGLALGLMLLGALIVGFSLLNAVSVVLALILMGPLIVYVAVLIVCRLYTLWAYHYILKDGSVSGKGMVDGSYEVSMLMGGIPMLEPVPVGMDYNYIVISSRRVPRIKVRVAVSDNRLYGYQDRVTNLDFAN